jgi:Ala-tRNA(Pro) deacylase
MEAAAGIGPVAPEEGDPATYHAVLHKLRSRGISFDHLGPHEPTPTSEDAAATRQKHGWTNATLASGAKAILLSNAKDAATPFILCVMSASQKLDSKKLKKAVPNAKAAKWATPEEVLDVTGCVSGAVPPFGSLFRVPGDPGKPVPTFMDESLRAQGPIINFNCGLKTRSVQMTVQDFIDLERPVICSFT